MKEGQTDFLDLMEPDEPEGASPEPAPEPTAKATPEPAEPSAQPRTPDGKFAEKPKAEEVEKGGKQPEAHAPAQPAPPAGEEAELVPKSVVLALRKELQEAKAKLQPPAQPAPQPNPAPAKGPEFQVPEVDYEQDPRGFVEANLHTLKMQQSRFFAVQQSSEAEVDEAWAAFDDACKSDPAVNAWSFSPELRAHPHPIGEVLKWHRKQKQLAQIESAGGLDAFIAAKIAEATANGGAQPAPMAAAATARPQAAQSPPTPPPSLARGGNGQVDAPELPNEDEDFQSFFREMKQPRKR